MSFGSKRIAEPLAQVVSKVSPPPAPEAPDAEKLKRAGRASLLIETGTRGVLGNAKTGRASLLST